VWKPYVFCHDSHYSTSCFLYILTFTDFVLTWKLLDVYDRNRPLAKHFIDNSKFPRHYLCVCNLRIFKSFVWFVLDRGAIIHSMRSRLEEYLLICLPVLMSDYVLSGRNSVSNFHRPLLPCISCHLQIRVYRYI
jgi:hypothetical protein